MSANKAWLSLVLLGVVLCESPATWPQSCKLVRSEFSGDKVFLATAINGRGEFWFGVDSASNVSVIASSVQNNLALSRLVVPMFSFTGLILSPRPSLQVSGLESVRKSTRHKVDGLIGEELFRHFVVQIDYEKATVTLCPDGTHPRGPLGNKIRIEARDLPIMGVVRAHMKAKDNTQFDAQLQLDTGGSFAVELLSPFVAQHPGVHTPGETQILGLGLTGSQTDIESTLACLIHEG